MGKGNEKHSFFSRRSAEIPDVPYSRRISLPVQKIPDIVCFLCLNP